MGDIQMNIVKHREKLIARIKDKEHRDAFVSARIQVGIPLQIRALREQKGWSQQELADQAGVKQSWIATIENPNYSGFSLKTLLKLASAFEIGLIVEFVPISNLVDRELRLSPESLTPVSFKEDPYFKKDAQALGYIGLTSSSPLSHHPQPDKNKLLSFHPKQKEPIMMGEFQEKEERPLRKAMAGG